MPEDDLRMLRRGAATGRHLVYHEHRVSGNACAELRELKLRTGYHTLLDLAASLTDVVKVPAEGQLLMGGEVRCRQLKRHVFQCSVSAPRYRYGVECPR